jgi:hypothetical protein
MRFGWFLSIWVGLGLIGAQVANHTEGAIHISGMLLAVASGVMVLGCVSYWWDALRKGRKEVGP